MRHFGGGVGHRIFANSHAPVTSTITDMATTADTSEDADGNESDDCDFPEPRDTSLSADLGVDLGNHEVLADSSGVGEEDIEEEGSGLDSDLDDGSDLADSDSFSNTSNYDSDASMYADDI